jgi:peptide/nickel transport system substrate-binding protein
MDAIRIDRRQMLAGTAMLTAASGLPLGARGAERSVTVPMDGDLRFLDPGYTSGASDGEVLFACMPQLATVALVGDALVAVPSAYAKTVEWRDPTHIDFELKPGLVWSGGNGELSASDVKYSLERAKNADWSGDFTALDHVEVTGPLTGTLVLNTEFAPFMMTLASFAATILPEGAMKALPEEKFTVELPALCSPYTMQWTPAQRVVFTANPEWTGEPAWFDEIVCPIIEEPRAAELAFEAGEIASTRITPTTLARYLEATPAGAGIHIAGELQWMWLGMNTENPKLEDIRVRKAIQRAVDVDSLILGAYAGTVSKSQGFVCPGLVGHRTESSYAYSPDEARALLQEAGVDGLELEIRTLNLQERMLAAQIIQANLQAVGITASILSMDSGPFWEMGQEEKGGDWQNLELYIMRFGTSPDPFDASQWYRSEQVGIWNWERVRIPEYDALYLEGIKETDPAKRHGIYLRMQELLEDTGAYVWLCHEPEAYVHRAELQLATAPGGEMLLPLFREG